MSAHHRSALLAVTGWSALSPLGTGAEEFTRGWCGSAQALRDVSGMYDAPLPVEKACALTDFRVRDHLGRKGTSCFDRSTSLTVVATGLALADRDTDLTEAERARTGFALGSSGGTQALCDFIEDTLTSDPPYLVNPSKFPYGVMNAPAGSTAIWHGLRGVNATISDGQASFLAALRYARNQLRNGYEDTMLVGGVGEFTPHRAWASEHLRRTQQDRVPLPLGEGAAVFVLEPASVVAQEGRPRWADVLSVEIGTSRTGRPDPGAVENVITRALASAGITGDDITAVATSCAGSPHRDGAEHVGVLAVLGDAPRRWLPVKERLGETYDGAGAFALAAVLAEHRADPQLDGTYSLVTSCTSDGLVAASIVRGWTVEDSHHGA